MKPSATFPLWLSFLTLSLSVMFTSSGLAQITLNESDFSSMIGSSFNVELISFTDSASVIPIIEQSGEDQVWDLSTFAIQDSVYGSGSIEFFSSFDGKPGADDSHFSSANVMAQAEFEVTFETNSGDTTVNQIIYSYSGLDENSLLEYGNVQAEASAPNDPLMTIRNTPPETVYPFPLAFGETWNYNYTSETTQSFGGQSSTEYSVTAEVDGWGEVKVGDIVIPALRIRTEETTEFSGIEFTSVTVIFIYENGFEFANLTADVLPFTTDFDPETANIQITAYDQINVVSAEASPDLPQSIRLNQNYPNPFNPATQITYQLDNAANVTLEVFSLTGQRVKTLVNGEMKSAGSHSISFSAGNLSSGVYMYRLRAGDKTMTRKMTLLK